MFFRRKSRGERQLAKWQHKIRRVVKHAKCCPDCSIYYTNDGSRLHVDRSCDVADRYIVREVLKTTKDLFNGYGDWNNGR